MPDSCPHRGFCAKRNTPSGVKVNGNGHEKLTALMLEGSCCLVRSKEAYRPDVGRVIVLGDVEGQPLRLQRLQSEVDRLGGLQGVVSHDPYLRGGGGCKPSSSVGDIAWAPDVDRVLACKAAQSDCDRGIGAAVSWRKQDDQYLHQTRGTFRQHSLHVLHEDILFP